MPTLYIEPFSGIAGDMMLSALASLADAHDAIVALPEALHLHDAKVEIQTLNKNGIVCQHIKIIDTGETASANHHSHGHDHTHEHTHSPHRHLSDIVALIDAGNIPDSTKKIAKEIFHIIGVSESRIHDIPLEKIHFHEVSGVDSILDIVGCALLLDRLEIDRAYCDPICVGSGQVKTEHGLLPVPAPATADILRGFPTYKGDETGERCTPTGAAILRYLDPTFSPPPQAADKIAYGPGEKDFVAANVVRVSLLENDASDTHHADKLMVIETNLDDAPPEQLGSHFQDGLLKCGAIDFTLTPASMKKGRNGQILSVLAPQAALETVSDYILEHSASIGVRYYPVQRRILKRKKIEHPSPFGPIPAKETLLPSGQKRIKLEHDALAKLSHETGIPLPQLLQQIPLA